MPRRVWITGLGPVSALGLGIEATWQQVVAGHSAIAPITRFDATAFACRIAGEVKEFKVAQFVPKSYRKATKVMARDIELAVAAADLAARDAALATRGTHGGDAAGPDFKPSYDPGRVGAHIGAGLIAAELNELTDALAHARDEQGHFDMHKWGSEGMTHLTPLWLLKYLPNMLACHVTIIHDTQGPSNTITCQEASGTLSLGESLRVIQRGAADACFCGGADSKVNPMAFLRQIMAQRINVQDNERPSEAVRPFCRTAAGTVLGEGGGLLVLEAEETFQARAASAPEAQPYAAVVGFGASQSVNRGARNLMPDPAGRGIALAISAALREAQITPDQIDLVIPFGLGLPEHDAAEVAALTTIFGHDLPRVAVTSIKSLAGNCSAGAGALDLCVAAKALREQIIPPTLNCAQPRDGMTITTAPSCRGTIRHVLVYSAGMGGQNAAVVMGRI